MKKRTLLIASDNIGLGFNQIEFPDIEYLQFPIIINEQEFRESETYTASWLIEKYKKEDIVARTTSIVKGELVEIVEKNKDKYDLIVHVVMSSIMSAASFTIAEDVRKMYEKTIPIINIDSRQAIAGVGVVLLRIIDIIKENKDADEIVSLSKEIIHTTFSYFIIPDLKYLYRGGRIGKAKALMGSVLRIIPVVGLLGDDEDGLILPVGKGRTFKQVNSLLISTICAKLEDYSIDKAKLISIISMNDNPEAISDLKEKLKDSVPCEKMIDGEPHLVGSVYLGPNAYNLSINYK
jgi:DegV family protein with EDD domain